MFKLFKKLFKKDKVNYFDLLPDEMIQLIFSFLQDKDLLNTSQVHQRFRHIALKDKDFSLATYLTQIAHAKLSEQGHTFITRAHRLTRKKQEISRVEDSGKFARMNADQQNKYLKPFITTQTLHNTMFEQAYTILFNTLRSILDRLGPAALDPLYGLISDHTYNMEITKTNRGNKPEHYEKQILFCNNLINFLRENDVMYPGNRDVIASAPSSQSLPG